MNVDEGILSSKTQLPVTQLNYGGGGSISYEVDFLKCHGKAGDGEYPSERNSNRISEIESRTTTLEGTVFQPDYYFKYYQSST